MNASPNSKTDWISAIAGTASLLALVAVVAGALLGWHRYLPAIALIGALSAVAFVFRQIHLKQTGQDHPRKWDVILASAIPLVSFFVCVPVGLWVYFRSVA